MRYCLIVMVGLSLWAGWVGCSAPPAGTDELIVIVGDDKASQEETPTSPQERWIDPALREHPGDSSPSQEQSITEETSALPDAGPSEQSNPPDPSSPDLEPPLDTAPPPDRNAPPDTNPPPDTAPASRWIGEACTKDADCSYQGGYCLKESSGYPGGHCTQDCTSTCPDQAGKPVTFCIDGANGAGQCASQCAQNPCRSDYVCQSRQRYRDSSKTAQVCVPKPTPGQSLTFLHIGDSQSSGTRFSSVMVAFLRNPQQTCPASKTSNNTVYSYARVSSAARHWTELSGSSKDWLCSQTTIYTNGTAPSNTTGAALCSGITNTSKSIFQKLIETHKPNAFLVQLGGNSLGFSESYVKGKVQLMLNQMPRGSLCFWVAPSYGSRLTERKTMETWLRDAIQQNTNVSCSLLTSITELSTQTTCNPFNASDGIHMTSCGSQLWGELIRGKACALGKL